MLVVMQATCSAGIEAQGCVFGAPAAVGDGFVGNNENDDYSTVTGRAANNFYYLNIASETAGAVNYIHVYTRSADSSANITLGLYDTSGNILAYANGNITSTIEWTSLQLNTEVTLTETNYIIGFVPDETHTGLWQSSAGDKVSRDAMTYSTTLSNFSPTNGTYEADRILIVYADNNATVA